MITLDIAHYSFNPQRFHQYFSLFRLVVETFLFLFNTEYLYLYPRIMHIPFNFRYLFLIKLFSSLFTLSTFFFSNIFNWTFFLTLIYKLIFLFLEFIITYSYTYLISKQTFKHKLYIFSDMFTLPFITIYKD